MQVQVSTCDKCGHQWIARVPSPLRCPRCGHFKGASVRTKKALGATISGGTPKAPDSTTQERGEPNEQ